MHRSIHVKFYVNVTNHIMLIAGMADAYETPELLDPALDLTHRSFQSAVKGVNLGRVRARIPLEGWPIDPRWIPK